MTTRKTRTISSTRTNSAPADPARRRLAQKQQHLEAILAGYRSVLIAFSGGVDSAYLAIAAAAVLGEQALAVTADSPLEGTRRYTPIATMSPSPKPNNIKTQPGAASLRRELRLRRVMAELDEGRAILPD